MTTGWPPGLLQDDERKLSRWLASRPDALYQLRKNMTQEDIIAMAREADLYADRQTDDPFDRKQIRDEHFAALAQAAERNKLASWMIAQGYATGHGDTMEGLLEELEREIGFKRAELWIKRISEAVLAEREACAVAAEMVPAQWDYPVEIPHPAQACQDCAAAIRARSDK
jgi:hypothetical protein